MSANAPSVNAPCYGLPNRKTLLVLYVPLLALLLLVAIVAHSWHIPVASLTRDLAAVAHVHPLIGIISNVGILLWCATAAICLFSRSLLRQQGLHAEARFLLWAGLMTIVLLVDDFFMIHEYIAPVHFHVDEKLILASYAGAASAYLLSHRRLILAANFQLLAAAMALFAASMLIDIANGPRWWALAEDGCKILGIASWLGYHAGRARHWLEHAPHMRSQAISVTSGSQLVDREGIEPSAPTP